MNQHDLFGELVSKITDPVVPADQITPLPLWLRHRPRRQRRMAQHAVRL
jgi:hypothetical protein